MDKNQKYIIIGVSCVIASALTLYFLSRKPSKTPSSDYYDAPNDLDSSLNKSDSKSIYTNSQITTAASSPVKNEVVVAKIKPNFFDCTVSAPGKVLIAGGYLVLVKPNIGIVISATPRFYSTVKSLPKIDKPKGFCSFQVESPQFHTTYLFDYNIEKNSIYISSNNENKFIEKCLWVVLSYARKHLGIEHFCDIFTYISENNSVGIKLRADNDFYSHIKKLKNEKLPLSSTSLKALDRFLPNPLHEDGTVNVAKTGMGSSAAMTTSLVGALLHWLGIINLEETNQNEFSFKLIHNLSQLAHAIAQDKCGSGFDISAAVYGTQVYVRFDPAPLLPCLDSTASYDIIFDTVNNAEIWNQLVNPFSLPPGLNIVMGDVCGGSSSASMAKEVMSWLKEKPMQSASVWAALAEANKLIFDGFSKLNLVAESKPKEYLDDITKAATLTADKWSLENDDSGVFSLLQNIRKLFKRTRFWLKRMGDNAGVGIEPDSQSALADRTESLPGVLCAGVPGAGGNDAVYAIVLSEPAKENVERVWSQWENSMRGKTYGTIVCPLTLSAESKDNSGVLIDKNIQW